MAPRAVHVLDSWHRVIQCELRVVVETLALFVLNLLAVDQIIILSRVQRHRLLVVTEATHKLERAFLFDRVQHVRATRAELDALGSRVAFHWTSRFFWLFLKLGSKNWLKNDIIGFCFLSNFEFKDS